MFDLLFLGIRYGPSTKGSRVARHGAQLAAQRERAPRCSATLSHFIGTMRRREVAEPAMGPGLLEERTSGTDSCPMGRVLPFVVAVAAYLALGAFVPRLHTATLLTLAPLAV